MQLYPAIVITCQLYPCISCNIAGYVSIIGYEFVITKHIHLISAVTQRLMVLPAGDMIHGAIDQLRTWQQTGAIHQL